MVRVRVRARVRVCCAPRPGGRLQAFNRIFSYYRKGFVKFYYLVPECPFISRAGGGGDDSALTRDMAYAKEGTNTSKIVTHSLPHILGSGKPADDFFSSCHPPHQHHHPLHTKGGRPPRQTGATNARRRSYEPRCGRAGKLRCGCAQAARARGASATPLS